MGALSTYLLDIIIAVIALVVIISSFFKPTFKYVRWLVGFIFAGVAVFLVKTVKFFNFVEVALAIFLKKINFAKYTVAVIEFFKGDIADQVKLIMGLAHGAKVRRSNRRGNYVYSKPFASFILSLVCVVFGIVAVTITFKALPFSVDYVAKENSQIMYYTYLGLDNLFKFLKSFIPSMGTLDDYIRLIAHI